MMPMRTTLLEPSSFRSSPWKNGGGTTIDIAEANRPDHVSGDWAGLLWRFGRTAIVAPGPFSDLAGCDRAQVVVRGAGLVLELPDSEIDVRRPWSPVRFRGEDRITSRLESGPVEVVNLIADRTHFKIDLRCWLRVRNAIAVAESTSSMPPMARSALRSAAKNTAWRRITH